MKVIIGYDQDMQDPLEFDDWEFHSFGRRHRSFTDPESIGLSYRQSPDGRPVITSPGLRQKLQCGTAFFCWYYEHGRCIWGIAGSYNHGVEFRWDGVRYAGLLIYKGNPKHLPSDRRKDCAKAIMEDYTAWCNGDVYYYSVINDSGDWIDSCGGFYDTDRMCQAIAESIGSKEFELEEEWEFLRHSISKETTNA